jgi:DNA repair protein RadC
MQKSLSQGTERAVGGNGAVMNGLVYTARTFMDSKHPNGHEWAVTTTACEARRWPRRAPRRAQRRIPKAPDVDRSEAPPLQARASLDVAAMDEATLLAAVLGCTRDAALDMLAGAGTLVRLAHFGVEDLVELAGASRTDAERIAAACELGRRSVVHAARPTGPLLGAAALARWFRLRIGGMFVQEIWVVALDDAGAIRGGSRISRGDVHGGALEVGAVVRAATKIRAKTIVLVHNHPSGDIGATPDDLRFVLLVHRAALASGVKLADCVIVGPAAGYTSLAEQGVLPGSP